MANFKTGITETPDLPSDRETLWVCLIGITSGLLYLLVYFAQRAIYLNGLFFNIAGTVVRGVPADLVRLRWEAAVYYGSTVALFALYMWLIQLCRNGQVHSKRARTIALLFPVIFNL